MKPMTQSCLFFRTQKNFFLLYSKMTSEEFQIQYFVSSLASPLLSIVLLAFQFYILSKRIALDGG